MLGPIRQATATWALAVALFGAVFALRLVVDAPGEAVGILFVVPIALLASRLGVAAGALGAVIALVLIATWVQVRDVPLGPLGWASRAVVFGLTGLALGWYAERLRAERALARRLVAEAPEALMDVDARGCVVDANPACEGLFAVGPGGLAGRPLAELVPARLASWRPALLDFLAAPGFRSLRDVDGLAVRTADGEEVPVDVTVTPRSSAGGAVVRVLLRDARAQRRQVDALRHTATLLATAEEVAGLGSWEWDLRTGRQRWSDELYRLLGLDPQRDEPTFDRFMSVVHPEDRPLVEAAGRRALAAQESSVNVFRIVHADGKVLVVEGAGRAIRDARGDVSVIVGTTQDITERKAAERALVHAAARHARQERTRDLLLVSDLALQEATLDHLFATMVARVCRALPCDGARLLASGGTHEAPTILAAQGPAQADWEARFPESIGQAAEVLGTGHALSDGGRDAGPASRARLAAAPLLQEDQVIGVLQVVRAEGGPFDDDDLGLLQLAADRLALAASHGRLVSRERHIAHTLQQSLLPRTLPEVPRLDLDAVFRPAGEGLVVGGDFYDAFPIGDDRWVLVVGDVCGKGAEAAALTALVRYTLRAEAMHEPRPGELLGLLNDAMLAQHLDHRFCTALCALIDVSSPEATLTIAAGGHPMPLIVRADGDVEPPLDPTGPIIGVLPGADFDEHMVRLKPGDALIAFTDGLIDAHAPRRIVTFHELARAASSTEPRSATDLVHRLLAVACGPDDRPVRDDIAVLAMRVRLREGDACGRPRGAASAASPASAVDTPVEMPAVEQEPERESGRLVARADGGQACATRACGVSRPAELARSTL